MTYIIYYIDNTRVERIITFYGYNYEVSEINCIIKIIDFCNENKIKKCNIYININNYIKKINKIKEFINIDIIKTNNITFKNYGFHEKYYKKLNLEIIQNIS